MRNVFAAATSTEAALVRNMLRDNGIVCQLVQKSTTLYPEIFSEVWVVSDDDGDRAVELIRNLYADAGNGDVWTCGDCDEVNPATFEVCWRCAAERNAAAETSR